MKIVKVDYFIYPFDVINLIEVQLAYVYILQRLSVFLSWIFLFYSFWKKGHTWYLEKIFTLLLNS